jgi:hypothetical protein
VAGGEGRVAGQPDERKRVGIDERRPLTADGVAQDERQTIRDQIAEEDVEEDRRPPPVESGDGGDDEEDPALHAEVRERDEDRVEPLRPVVDDPALEPCIEVR